MMIEEQKGSAEAESLLEDLGFDSLPIIPSVVVNEINSDEFKVIMEFHSFKSNNVLGKAEGNSNGALIYINSNIPDQGRFNFTAAHEIGHVCMHIMPQKKLLFECGKNELSNPFDDPIEKEANGFASGLLLPKRLISRLTDEDLNWSNIFHVSTVCKSSLEATYRRMSYLDRVPSAFIIHKDGVFQRFSASSNFDFYIVNTPLSGDQKSLCVDVRDEKYPSDFESVDAADWVSSSRSNESLETIYSSSITLKNGFVYTIITYDDDCFEDNYNNG